MRHYCECCSRLLRFYVAAIFIFVGLTKGNAFAFGLSPSWSLPPRLVAESFSGGTLLLSQGGFRNSKSPPFYPIIPFRRPLSHYMSSFESSVTSSSSDHQNHNYQKDTIRFLGRGPDAIVRPGCVLVAPVFEGSHYLMRAALLVIDVGTEGPSETNNPVDVHNTSNNDYYIRAVILDHPTPFTMKEMVPHVFVDPPEQRSDHVLGDHLLFRGGDSGGDAVLLLHSVKEIQSSHPIGNSGIYQGGLQQALQLCQSKRDAYNYKFFFNYCQFTESELEKMLATTDSKGDAWVSVEVLSPSFILNGEFDRGDAWAFLRNAIQQSVTE